MQGKTDNLACSLIFLYLSDSIIIQISLFIYSNTIFYF